MPTQQRLRLLRCGGRPLVVIGVNRLVVCEPKFYHNKVIHILRLFLMAHTPIIQTHFESMFRSLTLLLILYAPFAFCLCKRCEIIVGWG